MTAASSAPEPIDRRDGHGHLRLGRRQLGDHTTGTGQRAGQLVGRSDRRQFEDLAERDPVDRGGAGPAGDHHAGHDPGTAGPDRLGSGVAQLVEQLLHPRTVDRTADRDGHARTPDRVKPGIRPNSPQIGAQLVHGGLAACPVLVECGELDLQ